MSPSGRTDCEFLTRADNDGVLLWRTIACAQRSTVGLISQDVNDETEINSHRVQSTEAVEQLQQNLLRDVRWLRGSEPCKVLTRAVRCKRGATVKFSTPTIPTGA